jgi:hemolysin III
LGLLAAIVVSPILIAGAVQRRDPAAVIATSIFSATMIFVYLTSTSYHALPPGRAKRLVRRFDHSAIYLLIAGTYTPFTLGALRGPWGWTLFAVVWGLALLGIFQETRSQASTLAAPHHHPHTAAENPQPSGPEPLVPEQSRKLSMVIYLAMGWLGILAVRPLWLHVPRTGFFLILAGGLAYTGGILFYIADHVRYAHFAWHLCVLAGSICHFIAVLWYSA